MMEMHPVPFGRLVTIARKVFGRCYDCGQLVRVDKPLLGSLHLCVTDETATQQPWRQRAPEPGRAAAAGPKTGGCATRSPKRAGRV